MPLRIEAGWEPEQLRGNYLHWKNLRTGETRKSYISDGQLPEIKRDLAKYRKLRSGLGYPWQPVKYEGGYVYYESLRSGETTKSFVPPEMREWARAFFSNIKPVTPGKAKVITLTPTGKAQYAYIERGNFTTLRETMTARDRALSPFASHPYTIRAGVVERVLEGNRIVVDGVVVRLRNTDTPLYKQNVTQWQAAKNYTENLILNKQVTLKILTDAPRDSSGDVLADVSVASSDVAGKLMENGLAPVKSTEPDSMGLLGWLNIFGYTAGAYSEELSYLLSKKQFGQTRHYYEKISVSDTLMGELIAAILSKAVQTTNPMEFVKSVQSGDVVGNKRLEIAFRRLLGENIPLNKPSFGERFAVDVFTDPTSSRKLVTTPISYLSRMLKPGYVKGIEYLNKFSPPAPVFEETKWMRGKRFFRQMVTLPNPVYHVGNTLGDSFNAFLGGLRDPEKIWQAHKVLSLPPTTGGTKVAFRSTKGKDYTLAEIQYLAEKYKFHTPHTMGETAVAKPDALDKLFQIPLPSTKFPFVKLMPLQKISDFENSRIRYSVFLDRLQKGDEAEQAFQHSQTFLINYDPRTLTNFEQAYLYPNIPFYMWMRQNTKLQLSQLTSQPQTYATGSKLIHPLSPTPDERERLRDYQRNYILIRNPAQPNTFIRIRLPVEDLALFDNRLSTPEKAALLMYPHLSAIIELTIDRNLMDNSRPSNDYATYIAKKFSGGLYWKYRDFVTLEKDEFVAKQFGFGAIEPGKDEYVVGKLLMDAQMAKTYEQMKFEEEERIRKRKAEGSAFVQTLMQNQTALSPAMRDRPDEWGTLDKILFPLMYLSWSEGAALRNIAIARRTGNWGAVLQHQMISQMSFGFLGSSKYYSWRDRLSPSDTNTFIRATKVLLGQTVDAKQFEDKGSKWAWREYGKNPQDTWEGGFWDRLTTDIGTDLMNIFAAGTPAFSSSIKLSSGKRFSITPEGIEIYNQLAAKYGAKEARHVFTRMLRENPEIAKIAAWSNGVRIAFTNFEVVPAKYSTDIINAATSTMWKYGVSKPLIQPITHTMEMASPLVQILKNRLSGNKPIEYSTLNHLLGDLRTEIRTQSQLVKSEIYSLQQEAQVALGKGYANIVTKLIEDETLRAKYPQLKPIIDEIIKRNYNIAALEQTWGLLDRMRNNYILHTWTKAAREAMEEGALKLPPKSLAASSDKNIIEVMGNVINPYNYARVYGDTITQINEWSMKANGFPLLVENAFDIQKTREQMHVTSVAVMKFLEGIGRDYGEPLGLRIKGYAISKIPQLQNVQLPKELLRIIESDELIRSRIPELTQPGKLMRIVQASDTMQAIWKFSVTSIEASWYAANIQSGLFVNVWFAGARKFGSYKDAWVELARGNELLNKVFKMAKTGGTFKDIYGEEHTAAELIEEARKLNILGQEGALDISRHFKPMTDTIMDKLATGAKWATKASENIVRFPLFLHLRLNKGMSAEEAANIVEHFHFNYAKAGLSQAEQQVATRLFNFYVWYKNVPKLMAYTYVHTPSAISLPYKVMNTWNGEQGDVEKQYFTERQLARMMFKIPNTDAYVNPAPFSLMNAFYKWGYMLKSTEGGFYWDELKKDPELLTRFIKNELDVDWLNRGGGKVTVQGDKAVIEYMETGDTITARLDANQSKLVFVDDATGEVLKEYPTKNIDGKIGITKDTRPLEKIMGEIGARTLMMPIELALGRDFKFGSPIENPAWWLVNQFTGTSGRAIEEVFDPTINPVQKVAELLFGWFVDHLRDNRMVPKRDLTESAVKKVMDIEVWKIERGDYLGCGW